MDYLQLALLTFNKEIPQWYGWKTHDDDGNKIPNKDRMQYKYIKLNDETATMPSEAEVKAKIQELKDAEEEKKKQKNIRQTKIRRFRFR